MSDPHALPDRPKTPRAPALQPDRPGGGNPSPDAAPPDAGDQAAEQQKSQSEAALENVREGYGR